MKKLITAFALMGTISGAYGASRPETPYLKALRTHVDLERNFVRLAADEAQKYSFGRLAFFFATGVSSLIAAPITAKAAFPYNSSFGTKGHVLLNAGCALGVFGLGYTALTRGAGAMRDEYAMDLYLASAEKQNSMARQMISSPEPNSGRFLPDSIYKDLPQVREESRRVIDQQ